MALFRRGSGTAEAVYARLIDGEHLWLDVQGDGPLVLRRDGADDLELDADPFPIAAALADVDADQVELRLLANGRAVTYDGSAAPGPGLSSPPTRDRRWQFRVEAAGGELVVRRSRLAPTVPVLGFTGTDEGVELRLNTDADNAELVADGQRVAELPLTGGTLLLTTMPDLAAGVTATFRVGEADVVRSGNALERPMSAIALPPLPEPDVTLRWTPEAVLSVRREDGS